ncbi:MAG: NAD(P)-dependent glycerol-3-phosphate dehydrogenase [Fidelibacterota bacterium]|nr:MAG: NAD(P)-dependent glycerol-3-phosphate dehydrogenase [Candidatus Neomarinimicrobiota bacterium]
MTGTCFSILGTGSWGSVMGSHLRMAGHGVACWHFIESEAREFQETRQHPFLEGFSFPPGLLVTSDLTSALAQGDIIIVAVPSQVVREVMQQAAGLLNNRPILNLAKGIEQGTLLRMSQVIIEITGCRPNRFATVSGPSHAEEVMLQCPTTIVAASESLDFAREVQKQLSSKYLRVYASNDIIGVELGGSVKNVIAIAAGICAGLGLGDNTIAALITRGLAEITRLGVAMGADIRTFAGLGGIGDLVVTAYSQHSRNRKLGYEIGQGGRIRDILADMEMVAEGLFTAKSVVDLAEKYQVVMPICHEVYHVLFEDKDPRRALTDLMTRDLRDETLP